VDQLTPRPSGTTGPRVLDGGVAPVRRAARWDWVGGVAVVATGLLWLAPPASAQHERIPPQRASRAAEAGPALFADGFETQAGPGPSSPWQVRAPDCRGSGTVHIDRTVAHRGKASLRVDGAAGYCNHVFAALDVDLTKVAAPVHQRMFVRHRTPLPDGHVTFLAFVDAAAGGKDLRVGGQNRALQWNRASDDATLPEQSPVGVGLSSALGTDGWQCLEVAVDGATGRADTWLNGKIVPGLHADGLPTHDVDGQWTAADWRPVLASMRLGWESYGEGSDTVWFDDVVISGRPIGCSS
jgi:hypothetical protein